MRSAPVLPRDVAKGEGTAVMNGHVRTALRVAAVIASVAFVVASPWIAPTASVAGAETEPSISCDASRWVGVWSSPPSDASRSGDLTSTVDASANPISAVSNGTVRSIASPSLGGSALRVHLSNRFGPGPVTFDHVTVAKHATGPSIVADSLKVLTFAGAPSVTAQSGGDVVSDPVQLSFDAGDSLAVSIFVASDAGKPTIHYTARQTSYVTPEGSGDQTSDVGGSPYSLTTTTRPFLTAIDIRTEASVGTVVAFGDSITDGYQGQAPEGVPETVEGLDQFARYPDHLADRLRGSGKPVAVLNAGISGNRVLRDGTDGGNRETNGPSGLNRVALDAVEQSAVTTVILLEGINDLGKTPRASADDLIAGYTQLIGEMHDAGIEVLHGTLTPAGGSVSYGSAEIEAERQKVNAWIRTASVADGVVDFDAAVRDPADPARLDARYDGGDHLHLNPAGNQAMAAAVDLDQIRSASCTEDSSPPSNPARAVTGASVASWIAVGALIAGAVGATALVRRRSSR